jgi:hypothetical protein
LSTFRSSLAVFAALASVTPDAVALEVQFEGSYRARGRLYDTLSLGRLADLPTSEGLSWQFQHRFLLRPKFLVTDKVGVFADIRGLDGVSWGSQTYAHTDWSTQDDIPIVFSDTLLPPTSEADPTNPLLDFSLWRVWGEAHTPFGRVSVGRMPLHWGMGIWQNDGLGYNADYGDSADRFQWDHVVQDIFVKLAVDVNVEGLVNETDDTTSFNAGVAYRTEQIAIDFQGQLRTTPSQDLNVGTIGFTGSAELGPIGLQTEVVGVIGNGDLGDGINDVQISAMGAALEADFETEVFTISLLGAIATGDGQPNDEKLHTFTFDRDFNTGFILFEQPMPMLGATVASDANAGRDTSYVMTSDAIGNTMLLRPSVLVRTPVPGLTGELSVLAARTSKVPEAEFARRGMGAEIDATLRYTGVDHFDIAATFGAYLPGERHRNFSDEFYPDGFDTPVMAGQLITRFDF